MKHFTNYYWFTNIFVAIIPIFSTQQKLQAGIQQRTPYQPPLVGHRQPAIYRAAKFYLPYQQTRPRPIQSASLSTTPRHDGNSYLDYLLLRNRHSRLKPGGQRFAAGYRGSNIDEVTYSWNTWSQWTACSRSCDGGAKVRVRSCRRIGKSLKMNLFRGEKQNQQCVGTAREYLACNAHSCTQTQSMDEKKYDAREKQCSNYDGKDYNGKRYEWVPYLRAGMDECKLYCMAKGHRMFVQLAKHVIDGTPCGHNSIAECLKGVCQERNTKVSSSSKEQIKSNQANPTTISKPKDIMIDTVISKSFFRRNGMKLGYNPLLNIPIGAKNIRIVEVQSSGNYLALRVGKKYMLNGQWRISRSKRFTVAGTEFRYHIGKGRLAQESITGSGPITEDIDVEILFQDQTPKILVNYTIPLPERQTAHAPTIPLQHKINDNAQALSQPEFRWITNGFSTCTKTCGGGDQQLIFSCIGMTSTSKSHHIIDSSYCSTLPKPPTEKRMCNMRQCPPSWSVLPWKPCSKSCGPGGVQLRDIRCQKTMEISGGKNNVVNLPIHHCNTRLRPLIHRPCPLKECPIKWETGDWSKCSISCGFGVRTRIVKCRGVNQVESNQNVCDIRTKPSDVQQCQKAPCAASWVFSKWSACSSECGAGVKHRVISCVNSVGVSLPENQCDETTKPATTVGCSKKTCLTTWLSSDWTKCSTICGDGFQSRVVVCVRLTNGRFQEVKDSECDSNRKPNSKRHCSSGPCNSLWLTAEWSECSTNCGMGTKHRRVTCYDRQSSAGGSCPMNLYPPAQQACNGVSCSNHQQMAMGGSDGDPNISESIRNPITFGASYKRKTSHPLKLLPVAQPQPTSRPKSSVERTTQKQVGATMQPQSTQSRTTVSHSSSQSAETSKSTTSKFTPKQIQAAKTTITTTSTSTARKTAKIGSVKASLLSTTTRGPLCVDTRNSIYCRVIVRIPLCQYHLYKSRCCKTCADNGLL